MSVKDKLSHFSTMRRDTMIALGGVCLIFWAGIYFLFSLKPGQVGPQTQEKLEERGRFVEALKVFNSNTFLFSGC